MKALKSVLAAVIAISMLFTLAFAAEVKLSTNEIEYTSGDIKITVVGASTNVIGGGLPFEVIFDSTKWSYISGEFDSTLTNGAIVNDTGKLSIVLDNDNDVTLEVDKKLVTLTFSPVTDANVVGSKFKLSAGELFYLNDWETPATVDSTELTVVEGSSAPSVGTVDVTNKGTELTDNNGKKWKDVPTFEISVPITGKASSITAAITANEGAKDFGSKTYTFVEIENATLKFRIAVVGVPEGTTVTLDKPVITIN